MTVHRKGVNLAAIPQFKTATVKAGVLAGATYPEDTLTNAKTGEKRPDPRAGMPVAAIAAALNYGHGQRLARPFMNVTANAKRKEWAEIATSEMMRTRDVTRALLTTGQVMKEDLRETVLTWPADNSEQWAEFKGFNHGLILTSHLMNSIESEIKE